MLSCGLVSCWLGAIRASSASRRVIIGAASDDLRLLLPSSFGMSGQAASSGAKPPATE
jgi:hypothetical protein